MSFIASTDFVGLAAIIAALGTLFSGIAVVITASRTNTRVERVAEKAAVDTAASAAVTDEKLDQIHVLVNSRLDEALERIDLFERHLGLPPGADPINEGGAA